MMRWFHKWTTKFLNKKTENAKNNGLALSLTTRIDFLHNRDVRWLIGHHTINRLDQLSTFLLCLVSIRALRFVKSVYIHATDQSLQFQLLSNISRRIKINFVTFNYFLKTFENCVGCLARYKILNSLRVIWQLWCLPWSWLSFKIPLFWYFRCVLSMLKLSVFVFYFFFSFGPKKWFRVRN